MSNFEAGRGEPVAVFINPVVRPDYVGEFVRTFWENWRMRTVLLYPHDVSRLRMAQVEAVVGRVGVAGRFRGDLSDLETAAQLLRARYRVRAVVPQSEALVLPAAHLGELLGTDGMSVATATRFRDKYQLKEMLRSATDGPRINLSAKVTSTQDVLAFVDQHGLKDFVLKPNDGCGNRDVGFFSYHSAVEDIQEYFMQNQGSDVLLEEFIEGDEFCVNGQVTDTGEVITYSVQRTEHRQANGYRNLAGGFRVLSSTTPEFQAAAQYAAQVLTSTDLRSSPFHMEIKIGPDGPCMIEVGARLGGAGIPHDTKLAHGGTVDLFTEAGRFYASFGGQATRPDWQEYDSRAVLSILGAAVRDERVVTLRGIAAVERMPEFRYWVCPLELGQRVNRTTDLATAPWQATLSGSSEEEVSAAALRMRRILHWNPPAPAALRVPQRMRARAAWLGRRLPMAGPLLSPPPSRLVSTD